MEQGDYVSVSEAAGIVGCTRWVIRERIRSGDLEAFEGPDRRYTWLRRDDVERLATIRPRQEEVQLAGSSA
jgi:hypothetical protein